MSLLEDELLGAVQRSWVLERLRAIRAYEKDVMGAGYGHVPALAEGVLRDWRKVTLVPEYVR